MSGYEFEDYIAKILIKKGFKVEKTDYSCDGGIDLIAYYSKPLFSGKYIVQCKNWRETVGQPEIRDLYGVVMSENANKGILITTSDFTEQAYKFAKNKNIELINGSILKSIIGEEKPDLLSTASEKSQTFNYERYEYLQNLVAENPKQPDSYRDLICFIMESIKSNDSAVLSENLLEKVIELYKNMMSRCYKKKTAVFNRKACWYHISEIEIMRGNLATATDILIANNWFYISWFLHFTYKHAWATSELIGGYPIDTIGRNLFAAYRKIGFEDGCKRLISSGEKINNRPITQSFDLPAEKEKQLFLLKQSKEEFSQYITRKDIDEFMFSKIYLTKDSFRYQPDTEDKGSIQYYRDHYYLISDEKNIEQINTSFSRKGFI